MNSPARTHDERREQIESQVQTLAQILYNVVAHIELNRGYGGDMPPSPWAPQLKELQAMLKERGIDVTKPRTGPIELELPEA